MRCRHDRSHLPLPRASVKRAQRAPGSWRRRTHRRAAPSLEPDQPEPGRDRRARQQPAPRQPGAPSSSALRRSREWAPAVKWERRSWSRRRLYHARRPGGGYLPQPRRLPGYVLGSSARVAQCSALRSCARWSPAQQELRHWSLRSKPFRAKGTPPGGHGRAASAASSAWRGAVTAAAQAAKKPAARLAKPHTWSKHHALRPVRSPPQTEVVRAARSERRARVGQAPIHRVHWTVHRSRSRRWLHAHCEWADRLRVAAGPGQRHHGNGAPRAAARSAALQRSC